MLYAGFHIDDKWAVTAGKMCQAWGKSQDLCFFLAYVGRNREIGDVTKRTHHVSLGMMYRIKAF